MLFTEPIVGLLSLYVAFVFAIGYAFYATIPWIFVREYGFSVVSRGLVFLSLTSGYEGAIGTIIYNTQMQTKRRQHARAKEVDSKVSSSLEESLYLVMLGG